MSSSAWPATPTSARHCTRSGDLPSACSKNAATRASVLSATRAEYLATVNLNEGDTWEFPLKTLPRPTGRSTRVIITEWDLPRATIEPHDVIVDKDGIAWYSNFGEQTFGKLDPKTGKHTEYPVPELKKGWPTGMLGLRADRDGNMWLGMMYQAAIAKFDPKTEKFQIWSLPPDMNKDMAQVNMVRPESAHVDGKVWSQNNGFAAVHRLDLATGTIESMEPFKNSVVGENHNIYDIIPDSQNNVYFTDFAQQHIGRIDAKTGQITMYLDPDPQLRAAPRHDGRARSRLVRRISRQQDRHVRYQGGEVPGMANAHSMVVALRRCRRQERRSLDRLDDDRPRLAARSKERTDHRISAAATDQHPPRVRGQLDHARDVLGGLQPRRVDHQVGAD